MLEPDNALLCHCRDGLSAASDMLAPMLRRHGILLRGGGYNLRFKTRMQQLCGEAVDDPKADPHRPGEALAILAGLMAVEAERRSAPAMASWQQEAIEALLKLPTLHVEETSLGVAPPG